MNIYDFDETIFYGDSTRRFYAYCLKRVPKMAFRWPSLLLAAVAYGVKKIDKTAFKEQFYQFLLDIPDAGQMVESFWDAHMDQIKPWYLAQHREDDIIISASPEFLLAPICKRLAIGCLIASRVDIKTGAYTGKNCYGEEKVARFRAEFQDARVDEFYSDSDSDAPMARLARQSYRVTGDRVVPEILQ